MEPRTAIYVLTASI